MTRRLVLALVALLALPVVGASQQQSASAQRGAILRGRVTAADTGRPLRRAQVTVMMTTSIDERRTTSTNTRGEFELRDLPAGRYTLAVTRSGYLPWQYGRRVADEPGRSIEVAEGATLEKIDVAIPRAGIISGRIVDETAEPVAGVSVWIMRTEFYRGRRTLVPMAPVVRSDDTGQYRAVGLQPGAYVVVGMLRETWMSGGAKKQMLGYAPTFFPSTASVSDAQRVTLAAGKEVANVDIALVAMPTSTISGTAMRADGTPLAGASVGLSLNMRGPSAQSFGGAGSATVGAEGGWRFPDLPPGEYELEVSAKSRDGISESTRATIVANGTDIDGVSLVAEGRATITGEVLTDDGAPLPSGSDGVSVVMDSLVPGRPQPQIASGSATGRLSANGAFTITASSGPSVMQVWLLPKGWALKSVEAGGREAVNHVIDVTAGAKLEGVKVVITNRFPMVTARIVDDKGADAEGVVLLLPEDQTRWLGLADSTRVGRADQNGLVRFDSVPPGDYLAIALATVQPWQAIDPEFLATLKDVASKVTVREGQPTQLTLKIRP